MKKTLMTFAFCLGLTVLGNSNLFAQVLNAKDVIPPQVYDTVIKSGSVKNIHVTGDDNYVLLPDCEFKKACEENRVIKNSKNYPFVAEMVYKISKDELKKNSESPKSTIGIEEVSKIARSVSKMQGMMYYSTTRRKRMVLYKKAYMIDSLANPFAVKDRLDGTSDGLECYAFLEDASFGPSKYKLKYHENENTLYARFTNAEAMGFGLIKGIDTGNLIINMIIIDCGDSFVIYLGTDADCIKFPGIKSQLEDILTSRLDAIYEWFIKQF